MNIILTELQKDLIRRAILEKYKVEYVGFSILDYGNELNENFHLAYEGEHNIFNNFRKVIHVSNKNFPLLVTINKRSRADRKRLTSEIRNVNNEKELFDFIETFECSIEDDVFVALENDKDRIRFY